MPTPTVLSKLAKILAVLLGTVLLLAVATALLPARAVKLATERIDGLTVDAIEGRLVSGAATIGFRGHDLGRLAWSFRARSLFDMAPAVDWQLSHRDFALSGFAVARPGNAGLAADGHIDAAAMNRFLAEYHIAVAGDLEFDDLDLRVDRGMIDTSGTIRFSGGRATYRLSNEMHDVDLPGMVGTLAVVDGEPVLEVVSADESARLLTVRLDANGWAHIGVTGHLTKLAGSPWHGDDEAVVVTVSERLFKPGTHDARENHPRAGTAAFDGGVGTMPPSTDGASWRFNELSDSTSPASSASGRTSASASPVYGSASPGYGSRPRV